MEESSNEQAGNLPLLVLDWMLLLLKRTHRKGYFSSASDFNRNVDIIMTFKKSCGNALKFAIKNIPFALIQVHFYIVRTKTKGILRISEILLFCRS